MSRSTLRSRCPSRIFHIGNHWWYSIFFDSNKSAKTESLSVWDLITNVASYFDFETGAMEVRSEQIVEGIRSAFFDVDNLSGFRGVGVLDVNTPSHSINPIQLNIPSVYLKLYLFAKFLFPVFLCQLYHHQVIFYPLLLPSKSYRTIGLIK